MLRSLKILFTIIVMYSYLNAFDVNNRVEVAYVKTDGNTDTSSLSGKLESKAKTEVREIKLKASILKSEDNNEKSANKYKIDLSYHRMLGEKLYAYLGSYYEKDEFSDYSSRFNLGPGLGYKFMDTSKESLELQAGVYYARDKFDDGRKDEYAAPSAELNYRYKIQENIEFKQYLKYLISADESSKYFITSDTGLAVKMMDNLALGVSYRVDYVNKTEKEKTDKKFMTSLIFDF